jgi:tetratricopeptide (TPR) repeat protein
MRISLAFAMVFGAILSGWPARAAELRIRAGEKRVVSVGKAQGLALDNPSIADASILNATQIEIVGKGNGEGELLVFTKDGKTQTFTIRVTGAQVAAAEIDQELGRDGRRRVSRFGGKRIAKARCEEPLPEKNASAAFEDARELLKKDQFREAITKLDEVLKIEPDAALAHLFLGAAWAKLDDQARGASHYETFAMSCPNDPKVEAVVGLLRDFEGRVLPMDDAKRRP